MITIQPDIGYICWSLDDKGSRSLGTAIESFSGTGATSVGGMEGGRKLVLFLFSGEKGWGR